MNTDPYDAKRSGPMPGRAKLAPGMASAVPPLEPMLISPPGVQAPLNLVNFTADDGGVAPPGVEAPRGATQFSPFTPKSWKALQAALKESKGASKPKPKKKPAPSLPPRPKPSDDEPTLRPPSREE
jgi:hypothetical protein